MSTSQNDDHQAAVLRPQGRERLYVLLLMGSFLAFSMATFNQYPAVWCDEVLYSEPAINLIRHGSYTTDAYEFQPPNTFPIVNCPLYGLTMVPWLAVVGTNLLAVRSFNYGLMALGALLLWSASWRYGLVQSARARLLLVATLPLGYGVSFGYRCCRPDMLGMVCLLLLLLAFRLPRRPWRELCLAALGAVTVWIGLQVALYAWFGCLLGWLVFRRTGLREMVLLSLGMAAGAGSLVWFMYAKGMLAWFLPPLLGVVKGNYYPHAAHRSVAAVVLGFFRQLPSLYVNDFSSLVLTPLLLALLTIGRPRLSPIRRRLVVFCALLFFAVPVLFQIVGHFAFYYSYLRFLPATLAVFAAAPEIVQLSSPCLARAWRLWFAASIAGAVLAGLPLRLALTLAGARLAPRSEIQSVVASRISPQDVVFSDYLPFFEVKQSARRVYHFYSSSVLYPCGIPGLDLSPEAKQAVSVLVIRPEQKERLFAFFGGQWQAVTGPFGDTQDFGRLARSPLVGRRLASYAAQPQTERYQVQIFRRIADPPGANSP